MSMKSLVEEYFRQLHEIRASGSSVDELSYYPALRNLLDGVGETLKPRVIPIMNLKNTGAGLPDGGLFTADQVKKGKYEEILDSQTPTRGVIEVKAPSENVWITADGEQVTRYWGRYRQILVTNLLSFVLVGQDPEGNQCKMETFQLAENESDFWALVATPRNASDLWSERLTSYLKRVMLLDAPIASPEDVAWFLASYAQEARARIEKAELQALEELRSALQEVLGLKFEGEEGEHFFRSTLVQTLFYGLFSAWILWLKESSKTQTHDQKFNWKEAIWSMNLPMIRAIFERIASPSNLRSLNLVEILDWTGSMLNRVDEKQFTSRFDTEHAIEYFYEPFLESFDPELRKNLGVWYTPSEVVQYMVQRIDHVLREEMGVTDGLADRRVLILDPACGTGSYLVEILRRIAEILRERSGDALWASDLKKAATSRIFGFEILPAPYVVAHLQLGLILKEYGVDIQPGATERLGVYLTNSLTGWNQPTGPQHRLAHFFELEEEMEAANHVKRDEPILVILGNPPYNAYAGTSPAEEEELLEPYKRGLKEWGITKNYLDDLYVRFFRVAERRITEQTGKGIVCFISNFSYLKEKTYVVMRKRFLDEFDALWFDNMNGDSRDTGKQTPDGKSDPSVFSTKRNPAGIRKGTSICIMARRETRAKEPIVRYRDFWGINKRLDLLKSLESESPDDDYVIVKPNQKNRYSFRPRNVSVAYDSWPSIIDLGSLKPMLGLNENRGGALQDLDRHSLEERMKRYLDDNLEWSQLETDRNGLTKNAAGFDAKAVRNKVIRAEKFDIERVVRYLRRPFDVGWAYLSDVSPLWNRSRPDLRKSLGTKFLLTRSAAAATPEGTPFYMTTLLGEQDSMRGHAYYFPIHTSQTLATRIDEEKGDVAKSNRKKSISKKRFLIANLSDRARDYLRNIGMANPEEDSDAMESIWMHALAIGYSQDYLNENSDGIREDWPQIPIPGDKNRLIESANLGREIFNLLDLTGDDPDRDIAKIIPEIKGIASVSRVGGGSLNSETNDTLVNVGWGHIGKDGIAMPGSGKSDQREYTAEEIEAIGRESGLSKIEIMELLGPTTYDIFLNDVAYWKNVPLGVWEYTIGGFQVAKKWLSYREECMLGRRLTIEEIREFSSICRRISSLLILAPKLNSNYHDCCNSPYPWPSGK